MRFTVNSNLKLIFHTLLTHPLRLENFSKVPGSIAIFKCELIYDKYYINSGLGEIYYITDEAQRKDLPSQLSINLSSFERGTKCCFTTRKSKIGKTTLFTTSLPDGFQKMPI